MSQSITATTTYRRRLPSGTSKTGRRQYRSCDQCRKGKRACDIVLSEDSGSTHQSAAPCSNCAKTRKSCTLDWLNSNQQSVPKGKRRDTTPNQQQLTELAAEWAPLWEDSWTNFDEDMGRDLRNISNNNPELPLSPSAPPFPRMPQQNCFNIESENSVPLLNCALIPAHEIESTITDMWSPESAFAYSPLAGTNASLSIDSVSSQSLANPTNIPVSPVYENTTPHAGRSLKRRRSRRPSSRGPVSDCRVGTPTHSSQRNSSHLQTDSWPYSDSAGQSPVSYEHHVALRYNKTFITSGLVKIYHDSMENALSCWLTESTCPYSIAPKTMPSQYGQRPNAIPTKPCENGWSNRICEQVCHLDKAFSRLRTRPLTVSEDKAVDMSLRKAITAFATQWANSSERSSSHFSAEFPGAARSTLPSEIEFDRAIQESSWHEAKNALQNTAEIESFRVIFAHVIFALTQKPLDAKEKLRELTGNKLSTVSLEAETSCERDHDACARGMGQDRDSSATAGFETSFAPESTLLEQVLDLNGPPVFLETALRQIYSLRCKLEAIKARARKKQKQNTPQETPNIWESIDILSPKDRQTFDFLFWLCVMFDTLSSAITTRPLVVSDEDSEINKRPREERENDANVQFAVQYAADSTVQINISQGPQAPQQKSTHLWGEFLLKKSATKIPQKAPVLRWPCSYEAAEAALCDAAPIKVLLYRKVARLQTLLTRQAGSQTLESAISDALAIRDYWNNTYGLFFSDCIVHHESLPPRIQSWYTVLCGHWHLAGLLLADLIEDIDDQEMAVELERLKRKTARLVEKIRREDAFAASDLGCASCPRTSESFSQAKEFHTAVNKGALLTEPWTDVLVRSFSKAGTILIDMFPESVVAGSFDEVKARCEVCVEALWHLGKKSDIALLASQVLRDEMKGRIVAMEAASSGGNLDPSPQDNWLDTWPDPWDTNPLADFDDRLDTPLVYLDNAVTAW